MEKSEKKQPMIRIRGANENNLKSVDLDICLLYTSDAADD